MKKIKISCKDCNNKHCFVKQYASARWLSIIGSKKGQALYKKGHPVIREGDPVAGIYFIRQGKVKVFLAGLQGREQIVRLANDGHILGHRGLCAETYPISAVPMEDSMICFVDNATLHDLFMQNPKLTWALMMFYSRELRKTEMRMLYLGQMNVREKVAEALLFLMNMFGTNPNDNTLNVEITRQEIADLSGTSADQVTNQLRVFSDEKIIDKLKRKISIVNAKELEKIVSAFDIQEFFKQK